MNRLEYLIVREIERHRGSKSFATIAREKGDGRQMARQPVRRGLQTHGITSAEGQEC